MHDQPSSGSEYHRLFSERTLPLSESTRSHHASRESERASSGQASADASTSTTLGPNGINVQEVLGPPDAVVDRYAPGAPLWPVRDRGPNRKTAVAAIIGLAMSIVALMIVALLVVNIVHGSLNASNGPSRGVAAPLPTTTLGQPTTTVALSAGGLVVVPTQVTLDCQSSQSVQIQLTNSEPYAVSWTAKVSSSHRSRVDVEPASGTLAPGATESITLGLIVGNSDGGHGTIQFAVGSGQQTESPAQVQYDSTSCGGDGGN